MSEIPSTQVIRHWVAWGVNEHCPDEHSEHSAERVDQFERWLDTLLEAERDRILQLVYSLQPNLLTNGATPRDIEAFEYAIWQFRHQLVDAIKGEDK